MTVTVRSSTWTKLGLAKGQNRTVFRNPRGNKNYYSFYITGSSNYSAVVYQWSSDGVTWTGDIITVTSFGVSPGNAHCFDVKIRDNGSNTDVWVVSIGHSWPTETDQTRYRVGYISDAFDTINWTGGSTIDGDINTELTEPHCIVLARTDNGRLVVAFTEDYTTKGKDYRLTKLIGSDNDGSTPSWSGETTWDDPSADSNNQNKDEVWFGLENFSSSYPNRCFLYSRVPDALGLTTYTIKTAVPDWNGTVFSNTTQATWETATIGIGEFISGLIDESDKVFLAYKYTSTSYLRKASTAGDDDLGATNTISSATLQAITITLDTGPATDLLYVFYCRSSVDWNYRTTPVDSISFGDVKTVSFHQDIEALSSWSRQVENSLHIGGVYGTTVVYNEHPAYKALSTTLADLEFPDQNYYLGPHST